MGMDAPALLAVWPWLLLLPLFAGIEPARSPWLPLSLLAELAAVC